MVPRLDGVVVPQRRLAGGAYALDAPPAPASECQAMTGRGTMQQARANRVRLEQEFYRRLDELYTETGDARARTRCVVVRLVRQLREARTLDRALFSAFCRERAAARMLEAAE